MKKLYSLIALGVVGVSSISLAQQPATLVPTSNMLALHVPSAGKTLALPALADITVTGRVTDEKGEGLPGVSVIVKGTTQGATTDGTGSFRLAVPNSGSTLVFSFVGYGSKEIVVGSQTTITVSLSPDDQTLNEVVVVGYGSQLKKEITGSVQTVSAQEIKDLPVSQIGQKLQGRLAGVQINQTTGKPGQGISIRIRGQQSVSAGSDPLYVIDGFPITGSIGQLNPDEIEDISVLKDAASTSLYGSRAANGVVLITTRKGRPG
ncbi:MAG: SusC/RagA family TonB-linked outer membrane protein, partial [Spirosoma sp.]|nr:SusC/RagA family TonB-linked outer membrane protein [Spirosoma sp.]